MIAFACGFALVVFAAFANVYVRMITMNDKIERIRSDVAAQATVIASATTLLSSIPDLIRDAAEKVANGDDDAALDTLADTIEAQTSALAQAVSANTPAASEAPAPAAVDTGAVTGGTVPSSDTTTQG